MTRQGGWPASGFGQKLREVRQAQGLSQEALAERAGCHTMTVAKLEQGVQEPAWPLVLALARALGVSTSEFEVPPGAEQVREQPRQRGRPRKQPTEATEDRPGKRPKARHKTGS